jgi:hypothetical protein
MEEAFPKAIGGEKDKEAPMCTVRAIPLVAMGIGLSVSASYAGPCAGDIEKMQARIDAALEGKAAGGPAAKEGAFAGMSRQPTPGSMAAAEEKLGELSPQTVDAVRRAMAKARAADSGGDGSACASALAEVQQAIGTSR